MPYLLHQNHRHNVTEAEPERQIGPWLLYPDSAQHVIPRQIRREFSPTHIGALVKQVADEYGDWIPPIEPADLGDEAPASEAPPVKS